MKAHGLAQGRRLGSPLETDHDFVGEAARMIAATHADRKKAREWFFMWACILAHYERRLPGEVLDRFARSAPTVNDQRALMGRLKAKIEEDRRDDA